MEQAAGEDDFPATVTCVTGDDFFKRIVLFQFIRVFDANQLFVEPKLNQRILGLAKRTFG